MTFRENDVAPRKSQPMKNYVILFAILSIIYIP